MVTTKEMKRKMEKKLEELEEVEEAWAYSHQSNKTEEDIVNFYIDYKKESE